MNPGETGPYGAQYSEINQPTNQALIGNKDLKEVGAEKVDIRERISCTEFFPFFLS